MKHRPTASHQAASAPRQLRIIGGTHKRSLLPVANVPGLRPTPDRVRETLFNWLGQDLAGWRCWDAFAGSGALGLEAASRGASEVVLVELDAGQARTLKQTVARLKFEGVQVRAGDGLQALSQARGGDWDVVFLDPPFAHPDWLEPALCAAAAATTPQGLCYLESEQPWRDAQLAPTGWCTLKSAKAGNVHYHLLEKSIATP